MMSSNSKIITGLVVGFLVSGVSTSGGAEIALVPVKANGSPVIGPGNTITVQPGTRVFLELQLSDWDTDLNGLPLLRTFQAQLDSSGYTSGANGQLQPASQACINTSDCEVAFGEAGSECLGGFCTAGYQDKARSDWVFFSLNELPTPVDLSTSNYRYGAIVTEAPFAADNGTSRYGGTLVLDVPGNARGIFTVGFTSELNTKENFMRDESNNLITPFTLASTTIEVNTDAPCCLPERVCILTPPPRCVIGGGTPVAQCLGDSNANGQDDACEFTGCCRNDDTCSVELRTSCELDGGSVACDCVGDQDTNGLDDACEGCSAATVPLADTASTIGGLACEGGDNNGLACSTCDSGSIVRAPLS